MNDLFMKAKSSAVCSDSFPVGPAVPLLSLPCLATTKAPAFQYHTPSQGWIFNLWSCVLKADFLARNRISAMHSPNHWLQNPVLVSIPTFTSFSSLLCFEKNLLCNPVWLWVLNFLSQPPQGWDYRCATTHLPGFCWSDSKVCCHLRAWKYNFLPC